VDEGAFQKEMGGGGSGKLDLCSETPFILMRSNEGDDAMTNSDVSLLRIVERFQEKKKKKLRKVYFCTQVGSEFSTDQGFLYPDRIDVW